VRGEKISADVLIKPPIKRLIREPFISSVQVKKGGKVLKGPWAKKADFNGRKSNFGKFEVKRFKVNPVANPTTCSHVCFCPKTLAGFEPTIFWSNGRWPLCTLRRQGKNSFFYFSNFSFSKKLPPASWRDSISRPIASVSSGGRWRQYH
jgi:hypothetical protein